MLYSDQNSLQEILDQTESVRLTDIAGIQDATCQKVALVYEVENGERQAVFEAEVDLKIEDGKVILQKGTEAMSVAIEKVLFLERVSQNGDYQMRRRDPNNVGVAEFHVPVANGDESEAGWLTRTNTTRRNLPKDFTEKQPQILQEIRNIPEQVVHGALFFREKACNTYAIYRVNGPFEVRYSAVDKSFLVRRDGVVRDFAADSFIAADLVFRDVEGKYKRLQEKAFGWLGQVDKNYNLVEFAAQGLDMSVFETAEVVEPVKKIGGFEFYFSNGVTHFGTIIYKEDGNQKQIFGFMEISENKGEVCFKNGESVVQVDKKNIISSDLRTLTRAELMNLSSGRDCPKYVEGKGQLIASLNAEIGSSDVNINEHLYTEFVEYFGGIYYFDQDEGGQKIVYKIVGPFEMKVDASRDPNMITVKKEKEEFKFSVYSVFGFELMYKRANGVSHVKNLNDATKLYGENFSGEKGFNVMLQVLLKYSGVHEKLTALFEPGKTALLLWESSKPRITASSRHPSKKTYNAGNTRADTSAKPRKNRMQHYSRPASRVMLPDSEGVRSPLPDVCVAHSELPSSQGGALRWNAEMQLSSKNDPEAFWAKIEEIKCEVIDYYGFEKWDEFVDLLKGYLVDYSVSLKRLDRFLHLLLLEIENEGQSKLFHIFKNVNALRANAIKRGVIEL